MLSKIIYQAKVELKHNYLSQIFVNLIIIGLAYFIFGLNNLDEYSQGIIIERFLPIIGIFSLETLFYLEEKSSIKDILIMSNTRIEFIYIVRFVFRFILYGITTLIYIILLSRNNTFYELMKVFFHSISIGSLIGIIGLFSFSLSNNIALAFLISIGLMLAQWFIPKDMLSTVSLFTMPKISGIRIVCMFGICLILFITAINIWKTNSIS